MKKIKLYNKIAKVGTDILDKNEYMIGEDIDNPDGILVRSANLHDIEFPSSLKAIARAGAGVNNIPVDKCTELGIPVFNTPGANANGVKELAIAAFILASRNIVGGIDWVKTLKGQEEIGKLVEKGKSAFVGNEIQGKTLGVIGLGAIGGMVANTASSLGMKVMGCDPFITVEAAWSLSKDIIHATNYEEIYEKCDYITVHIPVTPETKGMFNKEIFAKMKDGVRFINLSRGDLVNSSDLLEAVKSGKIGCYVTDFPSDDIIGEDRIITIPHLGASTLESEDNCAVMATRELDEFLTTGNIKNSVNYPNAVMPHSGDARICVFHKNVPNVISNISSVVSKSNINIENMLNRSKKEYAYTIIEVLGKIPDGIDEEMRKLDNVIKVTVY